MPMKYAFFHFSPFMWGIGLDFDFEKEPHLVGVQVGPFFWAWFKEPKLDKFDQALRDLIKGLKDKGLTATGRTPTESEWHEFPGGSMPQNDFSAEKFITQDQKDNWSKVPETIRKACLEHLATVIPFSVLQEWFTEGFGLMFHFGSGMLVRNDLRTILVDEALPGVKYEDTDELQHNWDDFYLGALNDLWEHHKDYYGEPENITTGRTSGTMPDAKQQLPKRASGIAKKPRKTASRKIPTRKAK